MKLNFQDYDEPKRMRQKGNFAWKWQNRKVSSPYRNVEFVIEKGTTFIFHSSGQGQVKESDQAKTEKIHRNFDRNLLVLLTDDVGHIQPVIEIGCQVWSVRGPNHGFGP